MQLPPHELFYEFPSQRAVVRSRKQRKVPLSHNKVINEHDLKPPDNLTDQSLASFEEKCVGAIVACTTPTLRSLIASVSTSSKDVMDIVVLLLATYVKFMSGAIHISPSERVSLFLKGLNFVNYAMDSSRFSPRSLLNVSHLVASLQIEAHGSNFDSIYAPLNFSRLLPIEKFTKGGLSLRAVKSILYLAAYSKHHSFVADCYQTYSKVNSDILRDSDCLSLVIRGLKTQNHVTMSLLEQFIQEGGIVTASIVILLLKSFVSFGEVFYAELIYDRYVKLPILEERFSGMDSATFAKSENYAKFDFGKKFKEKTTASMLEIYQKRKSTQKYRVNERISALRRWLAAFSPEVLEDNEISKLFVSFNS